MKNKITGEWRIVLYASTTGEAEPNKTGPDKTAFLADELLCDHIENILRKYPNISDTLHIAVVKIVDVEQTN